MLRYFFDNPGDKARYAAEVLGVDKRRVNQILSNSLKGSCRQDNEFGWHLTEIAGLELKEFDQRG